MFDDLILSKYHNIYIAVCDYRVYVQNIVSLLSLAQYDPIKYSREMRLNFIYL